jgi:hypothetical protein
MDNQLGVTMRRIIVCGDSFCASHNNERNHFSQILEDDHSYSVINFARGGTDTINICFQIREAIKLSADIIVYCRTNSSRMTVPVTGGQFNVQNGLLNFAYPYPNESTYGSHYVGGTEAPFFSSVFNNIVPHTDPIEQAQCDRYIKLSDEQKQAVKMYVTYLHDDQLKQETDRWMYEYWNNQVVKSKIQLLVFNDLDIGGPAYEFVQATGGDYPTCYHTDRATQLKIVDNILKKIQT